MNGRFERIEMRVLKRNSFAYKMTLMALLASGIAAVTLIAAFLAMDAISSRALLRNRISTLADIVGQNSAAALDFEDRPAAEEVLHALQSETSVVSACLYDRSGNLFAQYHREKDKGGCAAQVDRLGRVPPQLVGVSLKVVRRRDVTGTLYLESDLKDVQRRRWHLLQLAALLLLLALAVGGIAGSILQRRISGPILQLTSAMQEVTQEHNFSIRVPVLGRDEITQLGDGLNAMLSELEARDREKKRAEAKLQYQAMNDELTGLPNRRLLADRLTQALAAATREHRRVALLYIDLDGFKLVNDSLGHTIGDILLSQVAQRLGLRVRNSDTLARLGGDEFSVILYGLRTNEEAGIVAQSLLDVLATPFAIEGHEITVGASIGVSCFPDNGTNAADLLRQADSAMYAAKRSGKNRVTYFTADLGVSVRERLNLENQLRAALARGEISVHYQPEFDIRTQRLVRFEALARWTHQTLGPIPPSKFIPVAEESGLIIPLGAYVMERACLAAVEWNRVSKDPVQVAVNVSSLQFMRPSFVDEVAETLRHTGLDPKLLQIELTESIMLSGATSATQTMTRLHDLGVGLAIDDFGTGYSCLGYLPRLPFDALKIDRSFVNEIGMRPEIDAMVHSLVTLAHNLQMRVIFEGIETEKQLQAIKKVGGNEVQGFLLGKPTADPVSKLTQAISGEVKELASTMTLCEGQ
jgi:diguanylate cyclase (GGDEF)-like protein